MTASVVECVKGRKVWQDARFRAYNSYEESFEDYASLIAEAPSTHRRWRCATTGGLRVAAASSGYATDPNYAKKLVAVMQQNIRPYLEAEDEEDKERKKRKKRNRRKTRRRLRSRGLPGRNLLFRGLRDGWRVRAATDCSDYECRFGGSRSADAAAFMTVWMSKGLYMMHSYVPCAGARSRSCQAPVTTITGTLGTP